VGGERARPGLSLPRTVPEPAAGVAAAAKRS
jgi:hypothetical protein